MYNVHIQPVSPANTREVGGRLKGHFAELGVEPICSYVVEKSFSVGDMKLKEMIAAELTLAESELSKTRNGPFLLKRCNIPSYVFYTVNSYLFLQ
jgi:nucleolar protein 9